MLADRQQEDSLHWAPPSQDFIKDRHGVVRRNLEDAIEELYILMDQNKERRGKWIHDA